MKIRCKFRLFVVHFIEVKSEVSFTHPHGIMLAFNEFEEEGGE